MNPHPVLITPKLYNSPVNMAWAKWTERNLPDGSSSSHAGLYLAGKVFPPVAAEKAGDSLRVLQSMRQDTASTFT